MGADYVSGEFDFPSGSPVVDDSKNATLPWLQTFARWQRVILSVRQSGPTASRPTSGLWVGQTYFDTTLNRPVWISAVSPAVVWRTADGVVA